MRILPHLLPPCKLTIADLLLLLCSARMPGIGRKKPEEKVTSLHKYGKTKRPFPRRVGIKKESESIMRYAHSPLLTQKEEQEEKSLLFGRPYLFPLEPPPISQGAEPKIMGNGLARRKILAQGGQSCYRQCSFFPLRPFAKPHSLPSLSLPRIPSGRQSGKQPQQQAKPPPPSWPTEFLHPSRGWRGEGGNGVACLFCIGGCGGGSPAPFPPSPPPLWLASNTTSKQAAS